jgi:hypothetical protein
MIKDVIIHRRMSACGGLQYRTCDPSGSAWFNFRVVGHAAGRQVYDIADDNEAAVRHGERSGDMGNSESLSRKNRDLQTSGGIHNVD